LTLAAAIAARPAAPAWAQPASTPEAEPETEPGTETEPETETDTGAQEPEADDAAADDVSPEERIDELEERLSYLEDAMDVVEKRAVLDRLQLGLDYRMILNRFSYRGQTPEPYDLLGANTERTTPEIWSHRLVIPMRADVTRSLRFTARLAMFKHFGDNDQAPFFLDFQGSRVPRDAGLQVEHAWLDWFVTDWLALSAGRLSYLGRNPPGQLKENTGYRIPTWGLNLIDGEYEAATVTLTPWRSKLPDLYVRAFYVSWFSDFDDPRGEYAFLGSGQSNPRIVGTIADMRIPKLGSTYVQLGYLAVPGVPGLPIPIPDPTFDPEGDYTNAPAPLDGSLLFPSVQPSSLGTFQSVSALLEVLDVRLGGLALDTFVGGSVGFAAPNGDAIEYELPNPNPTDPDTRVSTPFFVLPGAGPGESGLSGTFLAGVRLSLPRWTMPEPIKLGFEYNYGSRYSLSFAVPNEHLVSKWAVRGQAFDGYVIVPVYRDRMFVRAGVLFVDNQYWNGILGLNSALPVAGGSSVPTINQDILNYNLLVQVTL
jgi:hypothetical protein